MTTTGAELAATAPPSSSNQPRKVMKLRSAFPPPPPNSTTPDGPLATVQQSLDVTIDTRKVKPSPLVEPMVIATPPQSPKVSSSMSPSILTTPPLKRSPPRLQPSAKDSRKKERVFPATIRKPSTVDPPTLTDDDDDDDDNDTFPNPQRQQQQTTTGMAVSVKERVQLFQGSSAAAPVRRTDMAVTTTPPPKGILTSSKKRDPSPAEASSSSFVSTPTRGASSTLPFHHTPPARVLNPYDPAFSLQSSQQGSIRSHPSEISDELHRSFTPPPPNDTSSVATPTQANRQAIPSSSSLLLPQCASEEDVDPSPAPAALQRPLGRPALRPYVVQVAGAEWDTSSVWKYRVLVQRRQTSNATTNTSSTKSSFTQAFCFRSVPDFVWLEQALAAEYHGALLIPDLRIALQLPLPAAVETPVDATLLEQWLTDVLNGYRGAGEWMLPETSSSSPAVSLLHQSTSMESFLYKKILEPVSATAVDDKENTRNRLQCGGGADDAPGCAAPNSLVESFSALFPLDLCGAVLTDKRSDALATARDLQMQDSLAETVLSNERSSSVVPSVHSEVLQAQRDLATNYKASSLRCLDCLQTAVNHEERVGRAWRRLADNLGSLFRYESDVDLSDAVRVKYMPFRKLEADVVVDERLQRLVAAKAGRGVQALREVQPMLAAYIADVSAVDPAMQAYERGRRSVAARAEEHSVAGADESMSQLRWDDFRDWTRYNAQRDESSARPIPPPPVKPAESRKRSAANEKLLRHNLSALFQAAPLRRCRMAWKYYSTEAKACSELKTAAAALRSELDVVKPTSVSKLRKRHSRDEKADYSIELDLLQRMVHLGHAQKVQYDSGTESVNSASIGNEQVEVDNDDLSEERSKAIKRDRALELARQRIGQWNAALATSIMEAVGVEDPNVRVEETTRELRIVRKYAIGLRDRLNRCVEAMDALLDVVEKDELKQCRERFREAFAIVLSGVIRDTGTDISQRFPAASKSTLRVTGIDTNDSFGWLSTNVSQPDRLGDMSTQYSRTRDAQIEWLISSLSDLFKEYYQRIEAVEGFVYMECVGIQLEKNFSAKRSKALAAFEKKADLTAALAIATRKRMKKVVDEVQDKLRTVDASHTTVKETKEAHLESKAIKSALHSLAVRRLVRARELSTERATAIIDIWSKEEELNAQQEVTVLAKALTQLEQVVLDRIPC